MGQNVADLLRERARYATGSPNEPGVAHAGQMVYPEPYIRNPEDPYTFTSNRMTMPGSDFDMWRQMVDQMVPVAEASHPMDHQAGVRDLFAALLQR